MISVTEYAEIRCRYSECPYCDDGECCGGINQCSHLSERATACLPSAISDYEELKKSEPYGDEYYEDLATLKQRVDFYKRLTESYY